MANFPTKGWTSGWWCVWCKAWEPESPEEHKEFCPARTKATPGKWVIAGRSQVFMDGTSVWYISTDGGSETHMTITGNDADVELLIALQNRFTESNEE